MASLRVVRPRALFSPYRTSAPGGGHAVGKAVPTAGRLRLFPFQVPWLAPRLPEFQKTAARFLLLTGIVLLVLPPTVL